MGRNPKGVGHQVADEKIQGEKLWQRNARLREEFLLACNEIEQADISGDPEEIRAAKAHRERVADEFVRLNAALAPSAAAPFLLGANREDHEAAARLGLWEAFVGTDPTKANKSHVEEDGTVVAESGWDPTRGTFGTWSRRHIEGRASRSVAQAEEAYHGVSYTAFQQMPAVKAARTALIAELDHAPTYEQIAKKAGVTVNVVQVCLSGAPVSLSTPVGEDGDSTLADMLADIAHNVDPDLVTTAAEAMVVSIADDLTVTDLAAFVLRQGLMDRPALTVVKTADVLVLGRGAVNNAGKRAWKALLAKVGKPLDDDIDISTLTIEDVKERLVEAVVSEGQESLFDL
jgi:hypothetical protein